MLMQLQYDHEHDGPFKTFDRAVIFEYSPRLAY